MIDLLLTGSSLGSYLLEDILSNNTIYSSIKILVIPSNSKIILGVDSVPDIILSFVKFIT